MTSTLYTPSPTIQRRLREYTVNGYTFHMVQVQKGRFWMGDDNSGYSDEKPAHWVDIAQDFELGQYPVTQVLWEAVMGENPSYFKGADRPVEKVSWDDINGTKEGVKKGNTKDGFLDRINVGAFPQIIEAKFPKSGFLDRLNALPEIAALNAEDGCRFALPSEAQWEYAARGGRYGAAFPCEYVGSNYLPEVGWYDENSQQQTQPVGRKRPNALGLYDMSGNVWEWCEDVWQDNYKGASEDGSARVKGESGGIRLLRGGSWFYYVDYSRVSNRLRSIGSDWGLSFGFRLARHRVTL